MRTQTKSKAQIRLDVLERDSYTCQNCDTAVVATKREHGPTANTHHIVPDSEGGGYTHDNLVTLCESCHDAEHPRNGIGVEKPGDTRRHPYISGQLGPDDLNEIDGILLDYPGDGRAKPAYCRKRIVAEGHRESISTQYVQQRLARLVEHDHADNLLETGLYELIDDPREAGDGNQE